MKKALFGILLSLCAMQNVDAQSSSFIQQQLKKLAQSRPVKEMAIFKDLPGAINRCHISKKMCSDTDRKVIKQALIRIPIIMAAFAAAVGISFAAQKKDDRVLLDQLTEKDRRNLKENMVKVITRNNDNYLKDIFSKVHFSQELLDTYLLLAVSSSESDIVALLLEQGAHPSAKDRKGDSALYSAARRSTFGSNEYKIASEIITLLLNKKADVNAQGSDGRTPIMWAAGAGRQDIVDILISQGADLSLKDKEGNTVYTYATESVTLPEHSN